MPWIQIKFQILPDQAELLESLLLATGSVAVTFEDSADQPLFEPERGTTPLWRKTQLTALFPANIDTTELQANMKALSPNYNLDLLPAYQLEILEDKDWERAWMENFHPMSFGKRLWICPSWRDPIDPEAVNLLLDPGLAFGTGTHPTTSLCLKWLDGIDVENKIVIDYGCGSGVLGIAALLLGAKHMYGVDNDPQALLASKENAKRNVLPEEKISLHLPDDMPTIQADIMIANILAQPLINLASHLANLTRPRGLIILSGILEEQAEEVSHAYRPWFQMTDAITDEGWVRLRGQKIAVNH